MRSRQRVLCYTRADLLAPAEMAELERRAERADPRRPVVFVVRSCRHETLRCARHASRTAVAPAWHVACWDRHGTRAWRVRQYPRHVARQAGPWSRFADC